MGRSVTRASGLLSSIWAGRSGRDADAVFREISSTRMSFPSFQRHCSLSSGIIPLVHVKIRLQAMRGVADWNVG